MDSRFVVMQLRCDAFLQFCLFRSKQCCLLSNKAVVKLCFADVGLCDVYFRYLFVCVDFLWSFTKMVLS